MRRVVAERVVEARLSQVERGAIRMSWSEDPRKFKIFVRQLVKVEHVIIPSDVLKVYGFVPPVGICYITVPHVPALVFQTPQ